MTQLVHVINRIQNAAIRRERNGRGDLVYIVPSYTLPDGVVMNGGLYPAEEIAASYKSLEGTKAPMGHPYDENGDYISADDSTAIDYFYVGAVNKNVRQVPHPEYGNRVYVEKHINHAVAMTTERGRRLIEAIDAGEPIHTSTGVLLEPIPQEGEINGKPYEWIATNMVWDHDAILLDEDGAAGPEDGVGMMVNKRLLREVKRDGLSMTVNTAATNIEQPAPQSLTINIDQQDDEAGIMTKLQSALKQFFNRGRTPQTNREDDVMRDMIINALKAAEIETEGKTDDQLMAAYNEHVKGEAAEQPDTQGEQGQPSGELEVNADVEKLVAEKVDAAMKANKAEAEKSERDALAEKLKANGVEDISREEQDKLSVNSLQKLVDRTAPKRNSYGVQGGQIDTNSDEFGEMTMPNVEV